MEKIENNLLNLDKARDRKKKVKEGTHKQMREAEELANKLMDEEVDARGTWEDDEDKDE